jgi:predicted dehydrogenase
MNVACLGMGWWSDVLADAIQRSRKLKIVSCYSRSAEKRQAFAKKYGCHAAAS